MRLKPFCLTALLLALCLSGCREAAEPIPDTSPPASSSAPADTQTPAPPFALAYYPNSSLHPAKAGNRANLALAPLLYEGLFQLDEQFQPSPLLCQSYSVSEDGLSWSFRLRRGVTFSDGTPLTGSLAAASLNASLTPGSRYAGRLGELRSITGDEEQVTIQLRSPRATLPALLDIPITLDGGGQPLGTGPYVLSRGENESILVRREGWWNSQTLPFDHILLTHIQQADDLIAAFGSGDVTVLDADLSATNALGYYGSYEVWDYPSSDLIYLGFNATRGLCQDARLRRCIAQCIDRQTIAQVPYARHALPATLPVHPDSPLYEPELARALDYQPEQLAQAMSGRSLPSSPLTLLVNSENSAKVSTAALIAEQLGAAGLPVSVDKRPWAEYCAALSAGQFDLYLGEVILSADFDLWALLSSSGSMNYAGPREPSWDALLSQLRTAQGGQRREAARQLYTQLEQSVPLTAICFKQASVLTQWGRLEGLSPVQGNIFHALEQWRLDSAQTPE